MDEYTRDSLRELRKNERVSKQKKRKRSGSILITILIILLFLGAGFFYLSTAKPAWFGLEETITGWKEAIVTAFAPKERIEIRKTVDRALSNK